MRNLEASRPEAPPDTAEHRRHLRQLLAGYQVSRALLAVDELGLVKSLEQGAKSADEVARATGTHAPSVHRLLRVLASLGVVTEQDGQFSLGPLAPGLRELGTAGLGLEAGKLRLEPGTTKNDEARTAYLTTELKAVLTAQLERVDRLSKQGGQIIPLALPAHRRALAGPGAGRLPQGLGDGLLEGRDRGPAPPRLPADGGAQHGQRRGSRAGGHEGDGPQDALGVRPLPHREPRRPAGRGAPSRGRGHNFGHSGAWGA
jgi:hypothetical protein